VRVEAGATSIVAGKITDERGNTSLCGVAAPVYVPSSQMEVVGAMNMQGHALTGLPAPSGATDAVTKGYVGTATKAYVDTVIPIGGIILWSGSIASIPSNWKLCDGSNGTPDLRDRFVVGAGHDYAVGATGGEATHVLTINEMPAHSHAITTVDVNGTSSYALPWDPVYSTRSRSTSSVGGGQAHENRPPYYALAYIMRVA
jgi:microcystin-dependent protein